MTTLHLIASAPSHGDRHVDLDAAARPLGEHPSRDAALRAGRDYLKEHPGSWLQIDDGQGGGVEDVTV